MWYVFIRGFGSAQGLVGILVNVYVECPIGDHKKHGSRRAYNLKAQGTASRQNILQLATQDLGSEPQHVKN